MDWNTAISRPGAQLLVTAGALSLTACVPPAPLSVSGALPPPSTTYAITGDLDATAHAALADGLAKYGMRETGERPDRYVTLTLSDRPRASGTFAGDKPPASRKAPGWIDQPRKDGLFARRRRAVRLAIRFLDRNGGQAEERVATEVVTSKAPPADLPRLIAVALAR